MMRNAARFICCASVVMVLSFVLAGAAQAMPIFEFSFVADPSGDVVEGRIFGLEENGDGQQATSIVLDRSPFNDPLFPVELVPDPAPFNVFNISGGMITSVDLNARGIDPVTSDSLLLQFGFGVLSNGFNLISLRNNDLTQDLAQNLTVDGMATGFSVSPNGEVPSPAPLALMGAGFIAFVAKRRSGRSTG